MKKRLILTLLCMAALCALLSVTAFADALPKEATPTTTFTATGPHSGTLSGLIVGRWYYISSESHTVYTSDTSMELSYVRAEPLYVQLYGISGMTSDSDYQEINVTRQPVPTGVTGVDCTTAANNDGKLTGITTAMEYKYSTDSVWTDGTGSDITGLVPGTYNVRTKAAGTALSSEETNVIVHRYYTGTLYDIAVNDVHVTTDNYTDIFSDGKVSYDPTTDKLSVAAFNGNLTIVGNGTVDIEIDGGTDIAVYGDLTVTNANNVTVICDTTTNYTIVGKADITCTGDVNISNLKDGAVWGKLIVNSAKNVTVSGDDDEYAVVLDSGAEINCTGDVKIDAGKTWASCYGDLTIKNAANVTVKGYNNSDVSVNCTGAVLLQNSGNRIGDDITITGATNVTMLGEYSGSVVDDMNINCTGDVLLKNTHSNGGPTVYGTLTVTGARNVTAEATYDGGTLRNATLTCSGNVNITNHGTGQAISNLTVNSAKNVNVIGAWTYAILGNADITSSGNVLVKNTGSGKAVYGTVSYKRMTGAGGYAVRTGDTEAALTTVAAKAESEAYSAESCEKKIINILTAYTVIVQSDGNGTTSADKTSAAKGETVTLTATPAAGYHFKEWQSSDVTVSGNTFTMPEKAVSVKAIFEENTYTVTFDANGGSVTPTSTATGTGGKLATLPTPTRSGSYSFDGWYTAANGGTKVTVDKVYTADTTIYAHWTYTGGGYIPVTYTLTFNVNGGSAISSVSGTYGKVIDLDKYVPTKDGFDFGGWYSDSALTAPVDEIKLTGNKTIYARWILAFPFTDVKETDWSYDDIYYVWEKGLMQGTSATTFAPQLSTSRAMIVTILWRLEGEPVVNYAMSFDDVADGQWYTEAIRWAQANKIVEGYSAEKFGTNDDITREQMATILYRYAQSKGEGFTGSWMFPLDFEDAADVSDWANEAMHWCVMKGLINGVGNDLLNPQGYATREQVAAILHRFCENIVK